MNKPFILKKKKYLYGCLYTYYALNYVVLSYFFSSVYSLGKPWDKRSLGFGFYWIPLYNIKYHFISHAFFIYYRVRTSNLM